ncbi:MAG: restriction endonuclease subunit S [Bacteroidetes bacterium]|nr:restriction endonuclease subunit S [Bacteroidota bacterium]
MSTKKYILGDLIEQCSDNNADEKYGLESVRGISIQKCIIPTKADMTDVSLIPYKIFMPESFAYVPTTSRNGEKITIAINSSDENYLVSSSYEVFKIKDKEKLLPNYLFMYFNRPEFDRIARFHSWGSAREVFSFADMCNIEISLPSLVEQQKVVAAYNAINENLKTYTDGFANLALTCQAYIEQLAKDYPAKEIGRYIEECVSKNEELRINRVKGISIEKCFIETKADMTDVSINSYLIVEPMSFAFVPTTSRNGGKITIALNQSNETFVVSSSYQAFKVKDAEKLLPEYLFLWLHRAEFDRYARFNSWGSAREVFGFSDMCQVKIPIPPLEIQKSIVAIYQAQTEREQIATELKRLLKEVCPVLIKNVIEEK